MASTIKFFIIIMLFVINSKAEENNIKYYSEDSGILSLMYHRFDENKYPSTNIQMDIFKEQMSIINTLNYKFYDPQYLQKKFDITKNINIFVKYKATFLKVISYKYIHI